MFMVPKSNPSVPKTFIITMVNRLGNCSTILSAAEEEFRAYEALKQGKESWESMFKRKLLKCGKSESDEG
jgi:hypothetical protein